MKVIFDDATRRRLSAGWNPRVCTAREYAKTVGVSERALRNWRARYQVGHGRDVPSRHDSVPLGNLLETFQASLADLNAALDAARAAVVACRAALDAAEASRSNSAGTDVEVEQQEAVGDHLMNGDEPVSGEAQYLVLVGNDGEEVVPTAVVETANALNSVGASHPAVVETDQAGDWAGGMAAPRAVEVPAVLATEVGQREQVAGEPVVHQAPVEQDRRATARRKRSFFASFDKDE